MAQKKKIEFLSPFIIGLQRVNKNIIISSLKSNKMFLFFMTLRIYDYLLLYE